LFVEERVTQPFADRVTAGRQLALALERYRDCPSLYVLALPRGGVPVAAEVARHLGAELDLMIVRKLGLPGQPELAMGAIASGGARVLNEDVVGLARVSDEQLRTVTEQETRELQRRERDYRGHRPWPALEGATVILVDDGLATGATMRAALAAVRQYQPSEVVVAIPVAPPDTVEFLRGVADDVVCLATPEPFHAVGLWYRKFGQVSDREVRETLLDFWQA
jgi:putative phosphoribosyl transferase